MVAMHVGSLNTENELKADLGQNSRRYAKSRPNSLLEVARGCNDVGLVWQRSEWSSSLAWYMAGYRAFLVLLALFHSALPHIQHQLQLARFQNGPNVHNSCSERSQSMSIILVGKLQPITFNFTCQSPISFHLLHFEGHLLMLSLMVMLCSLL